jgi:hypothetical protein
LLLAGGIFQRGQQLRAAAPVAFAGAFHVRHDDRAVGMTAHLPGFVHGFQYRFEFAAQMGGVDAAEPASSAASCSTSLLSALKAEA